VDIFVHTASSPISPSSSSRLPPSLPLSPPLLPLQPQIRRNNSAMDTEPMGKCSWVVWTEKESPDMGCVEGSVGV